MSTNFQPGDLRVSDAERDRAVSELSEHFQAGRLTSEEFDERSGQALRARTGGDLEVLFADLPRPQPSAMPPSPASPPPASPAVYRRMLIVPVAVALVVLVATLFSGHDGGHFTGGLIPLAVVAMIVVRLIGGRAGRRGGRGPW
ncbi:MAG TPA: DUF1707 domain-containing protein [Streptosporangiaceae bacterium]|nr:DUF1707 domain-containing protein [Streptosporangiaceae bacterium]